MHFWADKQDNLVTPPKACESQAGRWPMTLLVDVLKSKSHNLELNHALINFDN